MSMLKPASLRSRLLFGHVPSSTLTDNVHRGRRLEAPRHQLTSRCLALAKKPASHVEGATSRTSVKPVTANDSARRPHAVPAPSALAPLPICRSTRPQPSEQQAWQQVELKVKLEFKLKLKLKLKLPNASVDQRGARLCRPPFAEVTWQRRRDWPALTHKIVDSDPTSTCSVPPPTTAAVPLSPKAARNLVSRFLS
ncbi:hypothetical protein VD0002_g6960 [Verticillium dahliae]|uniref:Uncharacterized protein n=2 Tax=Verticillium dahliae TaxID=27337 RepID=G2X9A0_VERDV|nr:uncharacterized protein VDAG_06732 [Verticillium dahliae VdLs.17]KAF3342606.1 Dynein light chain, cytoplasmic [Verticillium dahliae VDG2]KAH6687639.1 hypothetical protein EV126DRAFT_486205 [Verticillium dahliae]EGY15568.1 hypothetical protein VDAG_06732 [Verticillium dahliae VdLs.17]PNH35773.1 hypothetical protein BJF96_g947 [Verticillium dahliae]PNH54217.1 hypothetical protein VD0003_g3291 [Verticillium dahliae]